jgi:multidrug resistance protein
MAVALVALATFSDVLAYSVAVPVLPDLSRRFGASPTTIGFLFASFGVTVLATSIPMGAVSDRLGRRGPLVAGAVVLAVATLIFAVADSLTLLFVARLAQGAADAVTWVVGFALVADLYDADERGRAMGWVMTVTTVGFMAGPTLGGWLYEHAGPRVPYVAVAALSLVAAAGFLWLTPPVHRQPTERVALRAVLRVPAVAVCAAAVVLGGGTLAMLEPVLSLFLASDIGLSPARVGLVFGSGGVVSGLLHPLFGRVADRAGGRRLVFVGLFGMALLLPLLSGIGSFTSAVALNACFTLAVAVMVTPSLAYMADAMTGAGVRSFGMAYGVYNFAWALGLLIGPAVGGAAYEHIGFRMVVWIWAAVILGATATLDRAARATDAATRV